VSKATPLRELTPGWVWNEAMRRAMVISIAGFFVPNLLANFGVIPQLHQSFQFMPGICGAAGVFSASMALFLGYFHHKLIQGTAAAIAGLSLPFFSTWFWFRVTNPTASAGLLQFRALGFPSWKSRRGKSWLLARVPESVLDRDQYICNHVHFVYAFDDAYKFHQVAFDVSQEPFVGRYVHFMYLSFGERDHSTREREIVFLNVSVGYRMDANDLMRIG
jgi:hypothetical protein